MLQRILGIVGWLGTTLVFAAVAIRFVRPEWDQYAVWGAWAGLACVVAYTLGQWREIVGFFRRRQARYGAMATVSVLVALAIVVAVNYLSSRQNRRWDLTANQQYSLSEQSVRVLQSLEGPVTFTAFDRQTDLDRFRPRLEEYAYNSDQVTVRYIDPDQRPVEAREYDVMTYGEVVVDYMGRRERTTSDTEQDITNALIKAVSAMDRKVYFLQGHGEKEPNRTERDGYSAASEALRRDNYQVERLVLAQQDEVPDDATVVLIAGPTSDLLPAEVEALRQYLARGGKLMAMLDPPIGGQSSPMPNLEALLHEWGVELGDNIVVDLSGATNDPSIAVAAAYQSHAITDRFELLTIYPLARSVNPVTGGVNGRIPQPFVETSRQSWAESDVASLGADTPPEPQTESGDLMGPVTVGVAVSAPVEETPAAGTETGDDTEAETTPADDGALQPETRIVVFGDSDFPTNAYGGIPGNHNLFANAISWLGQQENLIAVRPVQAEDRRVIMTPRQQQLVFLTSILVVPALVFGAGVFTWWRRR
jgi:ABC-type uncharacterized transport system involved in gliding motility auxiliary subunit